MRKILCSYFVVINVLLFCSSRLIAVEVSDPVINDTIDYNQTVLCFELPDFNLELVQSSHTVAGLHPISEPEFDFTPGELLAKRNKPGFYHLGDINFRVKMEGANEWTSFSSAASRKSVTTLEPKSEHQLAVSDLSEILENSPVQVLRYWENHDGHLALRFEIKNTSSKAVEIGALGIPLIFNNNHDRKTLDEAHAENVFYDPYIGMDAGYLQVIRLKGSGPVLLVVPYGETPFEAWNPLLDDPTRRGITFEGFHEWMPLTLAYAENEWKEATPWNTPSSKILKPGKSVSYGVQFVITDAIKNIEPALIENDRPVAFGVPGYVVPQDVNADLFVKYSQKVRSMQVEPEGALDLKKLETTENGWVKYAVAAKTWGRARLTITYKDGLTQTINYKVIKPEEQVVADNGNFLMTKQWFDDEEDLFDRGPSVITYDYEEQKQVTEDSRAWICGLSDEGGAGAWLNAIMKQLIQPDKKEVAMLEDFVQKTIWGGIQYNEGHEKYGVRKSMFYYESDSMPAGTYSKDVNYNTWAAWDKKHAETVERSYNYPHVAAAHWVMYRLARNYEGLVSQQTWDWYLLNAYKTSMAMMELAPYYAQFGQMEGSVFVHILDDLKAEGLWEYARKLEGMMKRRADHWASLNYPFGSEMPWDSTGQEEVYMWSRYFGYGEKAETTLKAILAYMPTIPHWAYNGNARRYWDFLYGGKLSRVERQIHHYGSALNAIPVLYEYKEHPDDLYLLRVGYGGLMGSISNITEDGFAPAAFHSFPSTLKNDAISGDYGTGYYGYAVNTSTYLMRDDEFGWLAFGGNVTEDGDVVKVALTTAAKSRVYVAPLKMWLSLDAGKFEAFSYNRSTGKVILELDEVNDYTPNAYLRIKSFEEEAATSSVAGLEKNERGQYVISLKNEVVKVEVN
ncbi:DUF5695 domain-containing protein [Draconibacterium sediminis]|uniref:Uncharacterized protein n=1 Tax=Draconibacterium sediminis TaxID=1544798 RepID=A0A0D8JIH4_9BACT|nr:DUF5695 domain-containing protein [Draconibacterium sediminis]KJF45658.1 hypothetical protein LH29_10055 [Draconibacterium sediminis]